MSKTPQLPRRQGPPPIGEVVTLPGTFGEYTRLCDELPQPRTYPPQYTPDPRKPEQVMRETGQANLPLFDKC